MTSKRIMLVLAALALVVIGAGCGTLKIAGQPIGGASPTPTNTRVVRPTFTPIPPATDTPIPTDTPTSTPTQILPTATATRRPNTPVPTKAPTQPPAATAPPVATRPQYQFGVNSFCEHAGDTYIKGAVYNNKNDTGSQISGMRIRLSYVPDGPPVGDDQITTDTYTFILATHAPRPGDWYVWVMSGGQRVSEIGHITTNNFNENNPAACWAGIVDFYRF